MELYHLYLALKTPAYWFSVAIFLCIFLLEEVLLK